MFSQDFAQAVQQLKQDKISGSEEIVSQAITIIRDELLRQPTRYQNLEQLISMLKLIYNAKPEMAAIKNVVHYFLEYFKKGVEVQNLAERVEDKLNIQRQKLVSNLIPYLKTAKSVATYSRSSSIAMGLKQLSEQQDKDQLPDLILFESRPMLEGKKLALEAASWGYDIKYFSDAGMAIALRKFKPDMVIVGADTIFPDGDVVNKLGSVALALLCREYKIPFYVVSSTLKLLLQEIAFSIQNYPAQELWEGDKPDNIQVFNPYFEIVPAKYITGYITEHGYSKDIKDQAINIEKSYIRQMYD